MRQVSTIILIMMMIFTAFHCAQQDPVVAEIGNSEVITLSEFQDAYNASKTKKDSATIEDLKAYLNTLIDDKIKVLAARQLGMDQDSVIQAAINRTEKEAMINQALYKKVILDEVIKESMMRDFYHCSGKKLTLRSIYIKNKSNAPESVEEARQKAEKVHQEIEEGRSFASAAKLYSDDTRTALNGGLQRNFTFANPNDAFHRAAFSLRPGELSDVIEGKRGFYIIRVEEVIPVDLKPYEEMKNDIRQKLMKINRVALNEKVSNYFSSLFEKYDFTYDESRLDTLAALIGQADTVAHDLIKELIVDLGEAPFFTSRDTSFSPQDFLDMMRNQVNREFSDPEKIKKVINRTLQTSLLEREAVHHKLMNNKDVKKQVKLTLEAQLKNRVVQKEVYDDINPTKEDVRAWYELHLEDKYSIPAKVQIQEIQVSDEDQANMIYERAASGENFGALAREYTERQGMKKNNGLLSPFNKGSFGALGKAAFQLKVGEIGGPVKSGSKYSIFKVRKHIPAEPKAFKNVKIRARRDLIADLQRNNLRQWLDTQRQSVSIHIHEKVLANVLSQ